MGQFFLRWYRFIFARRIFAQINLHLYKLSLRGMGILNSESEEEIGEESFVARLAEYFRPRVIVDAGANVGGYTLLVHKFFPQAQIDSFEPHPQSYLRLHQKTKKYKNIKTFPLGLSNRSGRSRLWDFADSAAIKPHQPTSPLASLYQPVIEQMHGFAAQAYDIRLTTLDVWAQKEKITFIDWLKIDVEGHERAVLCGAKQLLKGKKIGLVQFEFNEMNAYSGTHLRDFFELLPDHSFYRLLPNGLFPLGEYRPKHHEIFAFQNIVAFPPDLKWIASKIS